jgi:hypothetical protein
MLRRWVANSEAVAVKLSERRGGSGKWCSPDSLRCYLAIGDVVCAEVEDLARIRLHAPDQRRWVRHAVAACESEVPNRGRRRQDRVDASDSATVLGRSDALLRSHSVGASGWSPLRRPSRAFSMRPIIVGTASETGTLPR